MYQEKVNELNNNNLLSVFYSLPKTKVVYTKSQRNSIWRRYKYFLGAEVLYTIEKKCPALHHQIMRSYKNQKNIQSAVFSECVYAQTLANMFGLNNFVDCYDESFVFTPNIDKLLDKQNLTPRYIYTNNDKSKILIQAGGCNGIDCALIDTVFSVVYTIEFKESGAKISEPDLPAYEENGLINITSDFISKNPQFLKMLDEKRDLNFFDSMGHNITNFSDESVKFAVLNNYTDKNKFADVVCTEDKNGYLVMIPTNNIAIWAKLVGEIRPAGRNKSHVWTIDQLNKFLLDKNAVFKGTKILLPKKNIKSSTQRGNINKQSRYKINSLFFVYIKDCHEEEDYIEFEKYSIWQLIPTITVKIFFKKINYDDIKRYYCITLL